MLDKEYPDNDTAVSEIALIDCLLIVGQRCADSQRKQHEHIQRCNRGHVVQYGYSTIARLEIIKGRSTEGFDSNTSIACAEFAKFCAGFERPNVESHDSFSNIHGH